MTPKAPLFAMRSFAAVALVATEDWSSSATSFNMRPSTPPWAFCSLMRASAPALLSANEDDPEPLNDAMRPMTIGGLPLDGVVAPAALMHPTVRSDDAHSADAPTSRPFDIVPPIMEPARLTFGVGSQSTVSGLS